ncbi:DUF5753 domain-containing protein [Streptomyces sp. M19]
MRLWDLASRSRLPSWYQPIAQYEATADTILVFQSQLVHGLLQTRGYARAVFSVLQREGIEGKLEARMARQRILKQEEPPLLWVVLDEAVLHREIGGPTVMRNQLAHLLSFADSDHVHIQVLPFSAGAHTAMMGSFEIFCFYDQADVTFVEAYGDGLATANPQQVRARSLRYDLLRACALSPGTQRE